MPQLDAAAVKTAYRRQAPSYDSMFGSVSHLARLRAVARINALPGRDVLEVGVGTGLALPHYDHRKHVVGIDLSADMLQRARARVERLRLSHVIGLIEQDAEATSLPSASFDIAASMFVASVVPNPRALLAELFRLVRPGGTIFFVNHFLAPSGPRRWAELALAPLSHALGWHPDFDLEDLFGEEWPNGLRIEAAPPFGLFSLLSLPRP